jgi:hypothetical protein
MLLVFTSNANNSDEIKKELVLAGRHHVTVVPVRVEDVVPNDAFSYEFATRQWIDLFKNWEEEIELLASRLSHVLQTAESQGGAGAEAPAAARAPRRVVRRPLNPPLVWGAALFAVVILIGGGVFYLRQTAQTPQTTSPPPSQIAAPTPPASPAPLQQTAASTPPPAPVPAPAPQITVQAPTLVSPPPTVS